VNVRTFSVAMTHFVKNVSRCSGNLSMSETGEIFIGHLGPTLKRCHYFSDRAAIL